jgi:PhoPQ-activated pathogenicity-related protein
MGASKRGWTTWLVGAVVPDRVFAITPIVLDLLNFVENLHHQYRDYGGWSFIMKDYYDADYLAHIDDPNMDMLS